MKILADMSSLSSVSSCSDHRWTQGFKEDIGLAYSEAHITAEDSLVISQCDSLPN